MDNDGECRRFILVDDEYKFFFDHHLNGGDNSFLPPFDDDDNGESETRNLGFEVSGGSKRSKLGVGGGGGSEKKPINNRVPQKRKRDTTVGSEAEVSRAFRLATTRESIQRDNRASERRNRKMAEWNQGNIQRDKKARKVSESTKVTTSRDVPLVRAKVTIQRDSKARKVSESTKVNTSRDIPLVRTQETIQRDNNVANKMSESKVEDVPLFRTKEVIRRDKRIAERRNKKTDDTKAAGTSRLVHMERAVDKTPRFVPVTQRGTRKKNDEAVVDKDYMSYLTWLVDSLKASTTVPGPTTKTQKQSTMVPEKDHLAAKVKVEQATESCCSDDDDIIMVSDSPFLSGGSTPFVVSKSKTVIDLEKDSTKDESNSSVFTKELMEELEKPYDEGELLKLSGEVSEKKQVTRCRELRRGRVKNYETSELGPSYLEKVSDFDKEYRRVDGDDKARVLKLLRGFFFYLKNVTRAGSFKPWLPENQKKLGGKEAMLAKP